MPQHQNRLFIGLEPDGNTKLAINDWRERHLSFGIGKAVPMENFHITLSFLGAVSHDKFEKLDLSLQAIQASHVSCQTTELGTFHKPQVLYMGVSPSPTLLSLAKLVRKVNHKLSLPQPHSEYRPHISLFRKHHSATPISIPPLDLEMQFDQFHLYESVSNHTFGKPPNYLKRLSYPLTPSYSKP